MGHGDQGKISSSLDKIGIPSRYATLCLARLQDGQRRAREGRLCQWSGGCLGLDTGSAGKPER